MISGRWIDRLLRIGGRIHYEAHLRSRLLSTSLANRFDRSPVTDPKGPVVSLTTYGKRLKTVHLTIESIARGRVRPSRLILWLDAASLSNQLPAGIGRLQARGLEVRSCKDVGPYKKFYPYVESLGSFDRPLVTADDDVLYPEDWLMLLVEGLERFPDVVNCHRAHVIALDEDGFTSYERWKMAESTEPSFRNFATGVGGVIYPPHFLSVLKQAGTGFLDCCRRSDDIWLHAQALRAGYKVRQVRREQFRVLEIPGSQSNGLFHQNVAYGGNDMQLVATYRASDILLLRECEDDCVGQTTGALRPAIKA